MAAFSDLSDLVGVVLLSASAIVLAISTALLVGKARRSQILAAFAQVTLVPERRRRFVALLALETALFFATGVVFGLSQFGIGLAADADLPTALLFVAGIVTMGALGWVALRPRVLTVEERARARETAPILESLWMAPYRQRGDEAEELEDR